MTPQERAEQVCEVIQFEYDVSNRLRCDLIPVVAGAIKEAVRVALAQERAQRTLPGAPLTEGQVAEIRRQYGDGGDLYYKEVYILLVHVAYVEGLLRDAIGHGETEQYDCGCDAGLEMAAKCAESCGSRLASPAEIRALKRPTP